MTWGLGTILGPLVGGAFAESPASWRYVQTSYSIFFHFLYFVTSLTSSRWAFYINLVVVTLVLPIYLLMLPSPDPRPDVSLLARMGEIDFVSAFLMLGAMTTFVIGINFGGIVYSWTSPVEIVLFLVSEFLTILFSL